MSLPPGLEREARARLASLRAATGRRGLKPIANRALQHDATAAQLLDLAHRFALLSQECVEIAVFGKKTSTLEAP